MPAVIVLGDSTSRAIDAALRSKAVAAELQKQYSRFGIGYHVLRLGRLKLRVFTKLGIPVMFGTEGARIDQE